MKIGKLLISWDRGGLDSKILESVDLEYEKGLQAGKKLILCTLAARSGTRLLGDIFNLHTNATGITERYFEPECFYRYIKYNKLPIDTAGIIKLIKHGIVEDWKKGDIALVISPFFSHGIVELNTLLRPERIIFAINDPKFTVQSIYNKGFFEHKYVRDNVDMALGFQPNFPQKWYWLYLFGRLVPNGEFYREWDGLTRVGKIAWWGNKMNKDIWEQLKEIPKEKIFIFKLNEARQDYYGYYKNVAKEFGLTPILSEKEIKKMQKKGIKPWHNKEKIWDEKEVEEFKKYSAEWSMLYNELLSKKTFTAELV
ncbi:MAG: hypothetical protein V4469_01260 [Patescibacteria group bacterium]